MTRNSLFLIGAAGAMTLAAACSSSDNNQSSSGGKGGDGGQSAAQTGAGGSTSEDAAGTTGGGFNPTSGVGGSTGGATCASPPDADGDNDGFTGNDGDCNDCDPNVNPGAIEVATAMGEGAPADEDCDMQVDNVQGACDDGIALGDFDAMNGAKAIELCQQTSPGEKQWGVLNAAYVRANGSPANKSAQVGILKNFGPNVNVQGGKSMVALSSGRARLPGQNGACGSDTCSGYGQGDAPNGFPQDVPSCPGAGDINDDVALELKLRSPKNATGYQFFFKFQSFEYAEYVCTPFNDQFIALVKPAPMGSINGNISFDKKNNPVSVNLAFFTTCNPNTCDGNHWAIHCQGSCPPPPNPCCEDGPAGLEDTGFGGGWGNDAGATAWLRTSAPIGGGEEFSIRFAIWDTGDDALDSTVLVDNFSWIANGGTVVIGTTPVEDPK